MKRWPVLKRVLLGAVLLSGAVLAWDASAYLRGNVMARFDVARDHFEKQGYGLPAGWRSDDARLLRERYNIRFRTVAGCMVDYSITGYADGYNRVMRKSAERKFGHDVFSECNADARGIWDKRRIAANQSINESR